MQLSVSVFNIYDTFFEIKKSKVLNKLQKSLRYQNTKYSPSVAQVDLCISLISKMYNINEKALKNRIYAHTTDAIDENYREACGMLYFILLNHFKWSWNSIIESLKTNKYCIHSYVNTFSDSKNKNTKERYMYVMNKISELEF